MKMTARAMNLRWPSTGLGLALGCLGFVAALRCEAQNLVPNPGFEETDSCWLGVGIFPQGAGPTHWYSANVTPDHFMSCLPYGGINSLPFNFLTFQYPFEGANCAGLITYHTDGSTEQREWLMVPLLEPMVPGQTYHCSFRANAAFGGTGPYPQIWLANSHVGMLFTTYERQWTWGDPYPSPLNTAHIDYPQILSDTVGWTLVGGSFVADSAYTYLMIGNFFSNALTDTLHFADPNSVFPWYPWGYTMIDAVCVAPSPEACDAGQGVHGSTDMAPVIFPNPASDRLVIVGRAHAKVHMLDAVGRSVWEGTVPNDEWELEVGGWARGGYVLQLIHRGTREVHKFVLTE